MVGGPNLDVTVVPVMNFGVQHPNHGIDPNQWHDGDDTDASLDNSGPMVVDDGVIINDVIVKEPAVAVWPIKAFLQDAGNQVSDNESIQGDVAVDMVSQAEANPLEDSNSTVDVPWDEESQGEDNHSCRMSDGLLEENDDIAADGNADASSDVLADNDMAILDTPQVTQSQRYHLRPGQDWSYSH